MQTGREPRTCSLFVLFLLSIMAMMFNAISTPAQESKNPNQQQELENAAASVPTAQRPAAKPAPSKKEVPSTYARFGPQWFQFGRSHRGRLEKPSGQSFADDKDNDYCLRQLQLEMATRSSKCIDLFAMAQASRITYKLYNLCGSGSLHLRI